MRHNILVAMLAMCFSTVILTSAVADDFTAESRRQETTNVQGIDGAIQQDPIIFLTEFYNVYLRSAISNGSEEKPEVLVKLNCTSDFFKVWKKDLEPIFDEELGWLPCTLDRITSYQYCRQSPVFIGYKNLQVKSLGGDAYKVSMRLVIEGIFNMEEHEETYVLRVKLTSVNGVYKIMSVEELKNGESLGLEAQGKQSIDDDDW